MATVETSTIFGQLPVGAERNLPQLNQPARTTTQAHRKMLSQPALKRHKSSTSVHVSQAASSPKNDSTTESGANAEAKERKKSHTVVMVGDASLKNLFPQPMIRTGTINLVPLSREEGKPGYLAPFLVQMNGGGTVPKSFGVEEKENDGKKKVQLTFSIGAESDHKDLERLRGELVELVKDQWPTWNPDTKVPSADVLNNGCNPLVTARKKKKNGEDYWPGNLKATISPEDCASGKCRIIDSDTKESVPYRDLGGMYWKKAIFEFRHVYMQSTKSIGLTKRLVFAEVTPGVCDLPVVPL